MDFAFNNQNNKSIKSIFQIWISPRAFAFIFIDSEAKRLYQ